MSQARPERIFHIATRADWQQAVRSGSYTNSTIGRTLEEEGFIHASRREQVKEVFARYYGDVREPLVLLTIAPERLLDAEVRVEQVGEETFPHVYGPINRTAVVDVRPLDRRGATETMASLFLKEMVKRMALALVVMVAAVAGAAIAGSVSTADPARLVGAVSGLVVGAVVVGILVRIANARRAHAVTD